jgi:hypothetical protein
MQLPIPSRRGDEGLRHHDWPINIPSDLRPDLGQ